MNVRFVLYVIRIYQTFYICKGYMAPRARKKVTAALHQTELEVPNRVLGL